MMQDFLKKYAYPAHDEPEMLVIEIDNGRFMNPRQKRRIRTLPRVIEGYALRDIEPGEELTCNYSEFDPGYELLPSMLMELSRNHVKKRQHGPLGWRRCFPSNAFRLEIT